jgi:hypothetical protein
VKAVPSGHSVPVSGPTSTFHEPEELQKVVSGSYPVAFTVTFAPDVLPPSLRSEVPYIVFGGLSPSSIIVKLIEFNEFLVIPIEFIIINGVIIIEKIIIIEIKMVYSLLNFLKKLFLLFIDLIYNPPCLVY